MKSLLLYHVMTGAFELICLIIMGFIAKKVIRLSGCHNYKVTLLVIFIILTLLSDIVQHIFMAVDYRENLQNPHYFNYYKAKVFLKVTPAFLLQLTIACNLNSWAFYFVKIRQMAVVAGSKVEIKDTNLLFRSWLVQVMTLVFFIAVLVTKIVIISLTLEVKGDYK